ncbi:MAG: hypothetical protein AAGB14_11990, partial [Verrucomicrobiota bacterium]
MRISQILPVLAACLAISALASTPQQAAAVRKGYENEVEQWQLKLKLAKSDAERETLLAAQPDKVAAAKRMWAAIGGSLNSEWTLEPAAWFLRLAHPLAEIGEDG